jgi:hypothetical protein
MIYPFEHTAEHTREGKPSIVETARGSLVTPPKLLKDRARRKGHCKKMQGNRVKMFVTKDRSAESVVIH